MSGIVFLCQKDHTQGRELLNEMTRYLSYRGPDGSNTWYETSNDTFIGMGQSQLHSTYLSLNEQCPFHLENRYHIVSDSRLDATDGLIHELNPKFNFINNQTVDSVLLLYSFVLWKERCIEHIIGDFCFFVWDSVERKLFAARNHTGSIPIYYSTLKDGIILSNTLNCIKRHPGISLDLNEVAIGDFLLFRQNWDPETTIYNHIFRISPGSFIVWKNGQIAKRIYWNPPVSNEVRRSLGTHEYHDEFLDIFTKSVSDRIQAPEIDTMLSGGMDSSGVLAIANKIITETCQKTRLRAFTITHNKIKNEDREGSLSTILCRKCAIPLTLMEGEIFAHIDFTKRFNYPEPSLHCQSSTWNAMIYRILEANKARLILTGFGADAFFRRHPNYWINQLVKFNIFQLARNCYYFIKLSGTLPRFISKWHIDTILKNNNTVLNYLNPSFSKKYSLPKRWSDINNSIINPKQDIIINFWSYLQTAGDADQIQLPVKFIHPYLDVRLITFFSKIPKFPYCYDKHLVRVVLKDVLPSEIISRPKTGISFELIFQLLRDRNNFDTYLKKLIDSPVAQYVDIPKLLKKMESNAITTQDKSLILNIFSLQRWYTLKQS